MSGPVFRKVGDLCSRKGGGETPNMVLARDSTKLRDDAMVKKVF